MRKVNAQFHLYLGRGASKAIAPGKIVRLESVLRTGSIAVAARHLGLPYRRAWAHVDELNRRFVHLVVERQPGGDGDSACVTQTGRKLIEIYREIEKEAHAKNISRIGELAEMLA